MGVISLVGLLFTTPKIFHSNDNDTNGSSKKKKQVRRGSGEEAIHRMWQSEAERAAMAESAAPESEAAAPAGACGSS